MLALAPHIAGVLLICIEGDLEKRLEAKLLVHGFGHGCTFEPALVVIGVGVFDVRGHEKGADASAAVGGYHAHPVDC